MSLQFSLPRPPLPPWLSTSDYNPQNESSLFRLPPEVRLFVFAYALVECDDPSRPYDMHSPYYRCEFQFAGKITIGLLLTCRQVYKEARLLPVAVNDHIFWQGGAPPGRLVSDHAAYFGRMSNEQIGLVQHVRFFADLRWLENLDSSVSWPARLALRKITITVRHTAWLYAYDTDDMVEVLYAPDPTYAWGEWIAKMPTLQELEVELESGDGRSSELEEEVLKARCWTFPLLGAGCLVHDGAETARSRRLASRSLDPDRQDDEDSELEEDFWEGPGGDSDNEGFELGGRYRYRGDLLFQDSQTIRNRKYLLDHGIEIRSLKFVKDITATV